MIEVQEFQTPVGSMIVGTNEDSCVLLDFKFRKNSSNLLDRLQRKLGKIVNRHNNLHDEIISQLNGYFEGARKDFDFPLRFSGTEFQNRVWDELVKIPYGQTISYLQLAERIGDPKAVRAVAQANGRNIIAIVVPCHRVIATNGALQGYGGGLDVKRRLLRLEDLGTNQSKDVLEQLEKM